MAYKAVDSTSKKLIQIDISSDTVCPWCFVGKKNLEKAISLVNEQYNFEVRWHPFFLNPNAPKEGIKKSDYYKEKFGASKSELILSRMKEVFRGLGFEYDTAGLTKHLDSHRLISFAAGQGYGKQNELVEELFQNYFVQGKYIGDNQVLLDAANKVGIEGAAELINDPSKGLKEVNEELQTYSSHITGVPHFLKKAPEPIVKSKALLKTRVLPGFHYGNGTFIGDDEVQTNGWWKEKKGGKKRTLRGATVASMKSSKPPKPNPFETIWSPGKKTLMKEYEESTKASKFIDGRLGEG
ncbi:hypothetical protein HPP92_011873 [Vanilla planifolia]|uniref:DSBA-like thioredoxin domain-containing protein n=1 Tax=Vanilla planifolia TaxID=51239 RepID=A0A835V1F3_VANPL|nr:hypothetical protein HPP92_011873 [Vanilla planifolia]